MPNPQSPIAAQAEELRPCPFCGAGAKIGRNFGRISAECTICGVSVRSGFVSDDDARKEVAEIWNTRAAPPEGMVMVPRDLVAKLTNVLMACKDRLENDPAVTDTIWSGPYTTLVDAIDLALAAAEAPQEGG